MGLKSDKELFAEIKASIQALEKADQDKSEADKFFKNPVHKYLIEKTLEMRYMAPKLLWRKFYSYYTGH